MPLFQKSVLKRYLAELPQAQILSSYQVFQNIFNHPAKQQNILNSKEEQYQEGFLRELFVQVLGYVLNPDVDYNLITEQKNEKDSKKSDGAILDGLRVLAVIELKSTKTIDLSTIESQAFGYKNNQQACKYVITSNFRKLRFYIDNAVDFEEFDLFNLTVEQFKLLWICLSSSYLLKNIPSQIKEASNHEEENVTKKLYADYARFRTDLFQNILQKNPDFDKLILFKKTQKLLDRFLFLFFAEDRGLVSPNWTRKILQDWTDLKDKYDNYIPLYNRFRKNFDYLNTGYSGKDGEIFAYNGGLFAPDEILDSLTIDDDLLFKGSLKLSNYDFESEVDVNILGHIFEHSLNEIDEIQASLQEEKVEKVSKRKKDGVFYTPKYITKYIVENTIGTLCKEQKEKLEIKDEDFEYIDAKAKGKDKTKREALNQKITDYRQWLLALKIVDPACGSGAFLNQALEFLIQEHTKLDELKAKLLGGSMVLSDVETSILENNLYGVDINDEAVEIAKLSLWLRTARKGRKLNSLNQNLKCGNSLIDDAAVAGEKAFNWQTEFKEVFDKGGFDVVIGNPPYVDIKALNKVEVRYYFDNYITANNRINLFSLFIEKSCLILNQEGNFSFIIPSSLLTQDSYIKIRELLLKRTQIKNIIRLPNESFGGSAGEVKVDTIILSFENLKNIESVIEIIIYKGFDRIDEINRLTSNENIYINQSTWENDDKHVFRINSNNNIDSLLTKIEKNTNRLNDCVEFCLGLTPYDKYTGHTEEQIANRVFHSEYKKDETFKKLLAGNDIIRYNVEWGGKEWISYGNWLGASREIKFFQKKRILVKQIIDWSDKRIWAAITEDELYNTQNAFNLIPKENFKIEYIVALINSSLMTFYHKKKFLEEFKDRFQKILIKECKEFPIKNVQECIQDNFTEIVEEMICLNKDLRIKCKKLIEYVKGVYKFNKVSAKIENWINISFNDFIKELNKSIKIEGGNQLSKKDEFEFMDIFEEQKAKALAIKAQIEETDKAIDKMVYELYELTEEEIRIVEG
ncbi:type IIS restriction enzyme Eco57I [Pedobacter glucosidilyticus]|uniref:site-specific DNA-methyltransferase (adenine-specific) n=1 Tax=Pedobacter aquae TaxID=2605747 RepID=A0A5C0VJD4_9SPHI|nr:TaqI-like C-terminal specificity domain-containing protein [Pedobacter glucosidilyticus]KHJ38945.1 type IIS restriction enzyme Eco57I [Pedobacter glucosidilyticus]QEK51883.1 N-6 DNA methylase [Pedobacter aquae]